jgi:hypothetical protein
MSAWVLPAACVLLEVLILSRGVFSRLFARYRLFYSYLFCILVVDICRDLLFVIDLPAYKSFYWPTQFLSVLVGYGVILEVTRRAFESYPGAERFSRVLILGIFLVVFAYVGSDALTQSQWSLGNSVWELERDLRAVQALILIGALALIVCYRIQIGRNLRGIMVGYGLYTGSSIMSNALRSYAGHPFHPVWRAVQPYTYLVCLLVWVSALWSYTPNPVPDPALRLEADYDALVGRTRGMLGSMRSLLERSARS